MKLEQQVVSLELAQKLKELGVKQDSLFYWNPVINELWTELNESNFNSLNEPVDKVSAYTVAELGEMLPMYAQGKYQKLPSPSGKNVNSSKVPITPEEIEWLWQVTLPNGNPVSGYEDTEADARAKTLVYLLENELITL